MLLIPLWRANLSARAFYIGMAIVIALRVALGAGQPLLAIGGADHDDELFIHLALNILAGHWLGPYDSLTLVKGPGYPLFLAANYITGLPLLLSELLVYLTAGVCLIAALRHFVPNRLVLFGLFVVYAFNPGSYDQQVYRVLREGLYPSLTVIAIAAAIGFIASMRDRSRTAVAWGLLFGLATAMFWLTREEGVWLVPTLVMLFAAAVWYGWQGTREGAPVARTLLLVVLPLVACVGPLLAVASMNQAKYGVFRITELLSGPFERGYGALLRVKSVHPIRFLPVPRDVREAIARESPAFKSVDTYLERATYWQPPSCEALPETCGDFGGAWFLWAFRDAVSQAGYYKSAPKAVAFYEQLAKEINAACDEKRLTCGPPHMSVIPPVQLDQLLQLPFTMARASWTLARYGQNGDVDNKDACKENSPSSQRTSSGEPLHCAEKFGSMPSRGEEADFPLFQEITHNFVAPPRTSSISISGWAYLPGSKVRIEVTPTSGHIGADALIAQGLDSTDVAKAMQYPDASSVRFNLAVTVGTGTDVRFVSGDKEVARLPLDRLGSPRLLKVEDPAVKIAFGEYRVRPGESHTTMFANPIAMRLSTSMLKAKQAVQVVILDLFSVALPPLLAISLLVYLLNFATIFRTGIRPLFWIATALLGAIAARVLLISLADVTSMPSISVKHFTSVYPLVFVFCLLSITDLLRVWSPRAMTRKNAAAANLVARPQEGIA